jgi:hypothetical protein
MATPYALSSDLVSAWPAKSLAVAQYVDGYKLDTGPVQNAQTGTTYTFVLTDTTKTVTANNAAASAYTVPPQASVVWEAYTTLRILNLGAGVVTLTAGAGVTLTGNLTVGQNIMATLTRTASDAWRITGNASAGVLQVKSTAKTDTFTMSSATLADVTGLSVAITPSSTANKVLLTVHMTFSVDGALTGGQLAIFRDSTQIALGDAAGSRPRRTLSRLGMHSTSVLNGVMSMMFLDSPATIAATTYKIQIASDQAQAIYVNRNGTDTDSSIYPRGISTITVMEVTP